MGDRSRSLPKIITAGVSFQIGKTSTRGAESESDRRGVESESARGIESESESARDVEPEFDRRGVESESAPDVESASESESPPFGATSPHPPFKPSAVELKDASTCPFISIEGLTISDLPPMGVLNRFLASPLMRSLYLHRLFVDNGSTSMAASPSISDSR